MRQQILAKDWGLVSVGIETEFIAETHRIYFSLNYILTNISGWDNYLLDEIYFFNHIFCSKTLFVVFSPWVDLLMTPSKLRNYGFSLPAFNMDEVLCLWLLTQTDCKLPWNTEIIICFYCSRCSRKTSCNSVLLVAKDSHELHHALGGKGCSASQGCLPPSVSGIPPPYTDGWELASWAKQNRLIAERSFTVAGKHLQLEEQ